MTLIGGQNILLLTKVPSLSSVLSVSQIFDRIPFSALSVCVDRTDATRTMRHNGYVECIHGVSGR